MGADGHVMFVLREKFEASEHADLDPGRVGWEKKRVLGHDILWRYWDTERDNEVWGNPSEYSRAYESAKYRSRPDRPEYKYVRYEAESRRRDLAYIAACEADPEHEAKLALGIRYTNLDLWLEANAEDWQVWT